MATLRELCEAHNGPAIVSRVTWRSTIAFVLGGPGADGGYFVVSFRRETGEWLGVKLIEDDDGGDGFYVVRDHQATAKALKHAAKKVADLQRFFDRFAQQAEQPLKPWGPGRSGVASPSPSEARQGDPAESGAPGRTLGDREELGESSPRSDQT